MSEELTQYLKDLEQEIISELNKYLQKKMHLIFLWVHQLSFC